MSATGGGERCGWGGYEAGGKARFYVYSWICFCKTNQGHCRPEPAAYDALAEDYANGMAENEIQQAENKALATKLADRDADVEDLVLCLHGIKHWGGCKNNLITNPGENAPVCIRCQLEQAERRLGETITRANGAELEIARLTRELEIKKESIDICEGMLLAAQERVDALREVVAAAKVMHKKALEIAKDQLAQASDRAYDYKQDRDEALRLLRQHFDFGNFCTDCAHEFCVLMRKTRDLLSRVGAKEGKNG